MDKKTMTREEAIEELEELKAAYDIPAQSAKNKTFRAEFEKSVKALDIALAALSGPTREQVDRVLGSMWEVDVRKLETLKDGL